MRVGDILIQPVHDGTVVLRAEMWAGSDWSMHRHLLDDDDRMVVPVGGFLVRTGDHLVLLDAGVGPMRDDMFEGGRMLDNLAALGVAPADIDVIVISHLHFDHVGWLTRDGAPTFANATIHIGSADWQHFVIDAQEGNGRAARLLSVESQVNLIGDGFAPAPGMTTRSTPGHTPGHTSTVISSGAERVIVLGDALHCPAQLTETEWEFVYDVDPALARRTRRALLAEATEPATTLLPCHFPGMQAARLVRGEGDSRWSLV